MHAKQGEARSKESSQELPPLHTSIDVKDVLSRQAPIQKLQTKRTQHKNSNKPSKRDAMGRYIPPPGQKPLTSLDLPTPGPQYDPQILQPFPEYSIQGKTDITRNKNIGPGPAANYTASKTHGGFSFGIKAKDLKRIL